MMINNVDALKKFAVKIVNTIKSTSYTTADFEGDTVSAVLKKMAVKLECAATTDDIRAYSSSEVLNFIAENYGVETKEPYDLVVTDTHATVTILRNGVEIEEGTDILYNGDKLKISAVGPTGYEITTLTVNGTNFVSGSEHTVSGPVTIIATGTLMKFYLDRNETNCSVTVTKGGQAIADGDDALTYGDEITISATASQGYEMSQLLVNGESFESGETLTVSENVNILATAEAEEAE